MMWLKQFYETNTANDVYSLCHCYTVNLPGKELSKSRTLIEKFRNHCNKSIQNRGLLFKHVKSLIGRSPVMFGGVRQCAQWEKIKDLHEIEIETIVNDAIPISLRNRQSEKSVNKLSDLVSKETLPRIMVEIAAVTDVGKIFCETTYVLEGDDPLGCCSQMAFEKIDRHIEEGVKIRKVTLNVFDKAGEMANELLVEL